MANEVNFILGYGERLSERVPPPGRGMEPKQLPYEPEVARQRMLPQIRGISQALDDLPDGACPNDQAVAVLALHPQFLAKSYFPTALLAAAGLRAIGSRSKTLTPDRWTRKSEPVATPTTELFVAGSRSQFRNWPELIASGRINSPEVQQLTHLEAVAVERPSERIRLDPRRAKNRVQVVDGEVFLEVALLSDIGVDGGNILRGFRTWAKRVGARADFDRRLTSGGLIFLPVRAPANRVEELASFSFVRVARSMPRMRTVRPTYVTRINAAPPLQLPDDGPLDPDLRVAVFDGGLDPSSPLTRWVQALDAGNVGVTVDEGLEHGSAVTSALLFGSIEGGRARRPYGFVDHYRVYDDESEGDPEELYDVLARIRAILSTRPYEFISLSIGPDLPVEDNNLHSWTAIFDEYLSTGETLMTVAVGNGGELDRQSGNARIMPPSDAVNCLAVGSADRSEEEWSRATYSSVGPGRAPGLIKPDVLAFGGSVAQPFRVIHPDRPQRTRDTFGTSFAGPLAMRLALGARAALGARMTPLTLKALLVHCADLGSSNRDDSGWGRIPADLPALITCENGEVRVLYQGRLDAASFLRTPIPLPPRPLNGLVSITATFAIAVPVDSAFSENYTQAGLEVVFRPHSGRFGASDTQTIPASGSFFRLSDFSSESSLRRDAHKWETVLHRSRRMQGRSLQAPVFDVHCLTRLGGSSSKTAAQIPYAAVITISAPQEPTLYNEVLQAYPGQLQAMLPVVDIPVLIQP